MQGVSVQTVLPAAYVCLVPPAHFGQQSILSSFRDEGRLPPRFVGRARGTWSERSDPDILAGRPPVRFGVTMDLWPAMEVPYFSDDESRSSHTDGNRSDAGIEVSALFAGVMLPQVDPAELPQTPADETQEALKENPKNLSHAALLPAALDVSGVA